MRSIFQDSLKQESLPGPGHYQVDVPHQIKLLSDKSAPRYRLNPFGSSISRFVDRSSSNLNSVPAVQTEEEVRVRELIRDLEEHTGVRKDLKPGVRTAKLMHLNILKKISTKSKQENDNASSVRSRPMAQSKSPSRQQLALVPTDGRFNRIQDRSVNNQSFNDN